MDVLQILMISHRFEASFDSCHEASHKWEVSWCMLTRKFGHNLNDTEG